jgi:hypothetical protein
MKLGGQVDSGLVITQIQTAYFLNTNLEPCNSTNQHSGDMIPVKMKVMTRRGDLEHPQKLLLHLQ